MLFFQLLTTYAAQLSVMLTPLEAHPLVISRMMFLMTFSVSVAFSIVKAHYKYTVCTAHCVLNLEWNIRLN
jgi:hypothetical protein